MSAVDMSQTIAPRSDQLNAEDLLSGPRTVTITAVRHGSAEQPVDIHLAEFDRPFKPAKTVRRILVTAWGVNAATYVGRRMTLYRDPAVKFGGMDVGGIRISHLSHIDKRITVALTVTRGKRAPYVIEPLAAPSSAPIAAPGQDDSHIEGPNAGQYVEEICDRRTSLQRIREIWSEARKRGLMAHTVTNDVGDEETLESLLKRKGDERQAEGGQ